MRDGSSRWNSFGTLVWNTDFFCIVMVQFVYVQAQSVRIEYDLQVYLVNLCNHSLHSSLTVPQKGWNVNWPKNSSDLIPHVRTRPADTNHGSFCSSVEVRGGGWETLILFASEQESIPRPEITVLVHMHAVNIFFIVLWLLLQAVKTWKATSLQTKGQGSKECISKQLSECC